MRILNGLFCRSEQEFSRCGSAWQPIPCLFRFSVNTMEVIALSTDTSVAYYEQNKIDRYGDQGNYGIGQKFKLWMGIYLDDKTPYYFPQGVFYITNPEDVYNPSERIITINGADKWSYLDGTLFGRLSGTYQTGIDVDLYSAIRELLRLSRFKDDFSRTDNKDEMVDPVPPLLSHDFKNKQHGNSICKND